jgi:hypothetical protein
VRNFLRSAAFLHNSNSNIIQSLSSINQLVGLPAVMSTFRSLNLMIFTKLCLDPT